MRRLKLGGLASAALAGLLCVGCVSGQSTRYYFAAADLDHDNSDLKFYRVTVKGCSVNTKSNMQTGWYDAEALHDLFGQVGAPTKTENLGSCVMTYNGDKGEWEIQEGQKRFTVIYGANADAMADQVKLFAESNEAGAAFGSLLAASVGGRQFDEAVDSEKSASDAKVRAAATAKQLKDLSGKLDDKDLTPEKVRLILLQAAQAGAAALGSTATFDSSSADAGFTQAQATYDAQAANLK